MISYRHHNYLDQVARNPGHLQSRNPLCEVQTAFYVSWCRWTCIWIYTRTELCLWKQGEMASNKEGWQSKWKLRSSRGIATLGIQQDKKLANWLGSRTYSVYMRLDAWPHMASAWRESSRVSLWCVAGWKRGTGSSRVHTDIHSVEMLDAGYFWRPIQASSQLYYGAIRI